ncbi:MAG: hypothetical protein CME88_09795 [Hirschia sp.]|nr:hypothetical protein [Hirschia sp.]|tara:strand:- start:304 stop:501 length:198 start_codon:yes stop_codon:yes gene_type:complete
MEAIIGNACYPGTGVVKQDLFVALCISALTSGTITIKLTMPDLRSESRRARIMTGLLNQPNSRMG